MFSKTKLGSRLLETLVLNPFEAMPGVYNGHRFSLKVLIPDYEKIIKEHYAAYIPSDLSEINSRLILPSDFKHFGVVCEFENLTEVELYDEYMTLDNYVRESIRRFGPIIFKNVFFNEKRRSDGHRNRFPHLNFHVDRSVKQATHYSCYLRDCFDQEQQQPRKSSTLFIANIVGYLQAVKEKQYSPSEQEKHISHVDIFRDVDVAQLINQLIIEHAWNEPIGCGEISIIDNTTVLHSSYYRNKLEKGYRIGVRYLQ